MDHTISSVIQKIEALLPIRDQVVVAIDGPCASGKTTLAAVLEAHFSCTVLHLDDFFLRPEQRTPERLAQPGGNVDYERFASEVLTPLKLGAPFSYRPFDCGTMTLAEPVSVTPGKLTIIEGSYSHHPHFGEYCHLRIFLRVGPALQRERILLRPAFLHQRFFREWIPMEQRYFDAFRILDKADMTLQAEQL